MGQEGGAGGRVGGWDDRVREGGWVDQVSGCGRVGGLTR